MINIENPMAVDGLWDDEEKRWGTDAMGDPIMEGDEIIEIDGATVLTENLDDFLLKHFGARFTIAK